MKNINKDNILKFMLWKDILIIPTYTILFYNNMVLFWCLIIIDRVVNLKICTKYIKIDELIDNALEKEETKIMQLLIFVAITGITLYIIIFMKHRQLFYILILVEVIDYIISRKI